MTEGELKKKINLDDLVQKGYIKVEDAQQRIYDILDEAKKEFPIDMSIWLPWAHSTMKELQKGITMDAFKVQMAQMIIWFDKWHGDDKP